jgi:hypothetical protein
MGLACCYWRPPSLYLCRTSTASFPRHNKHSTSLPPTRINLTALDTQLCVIWTTSLSMSIVSLLGVEVKNNPATFDAPYEFLITFECHEPLQKGDSDSQLLVSYADRL